MLRIYELVSLFLALSGPFFFPRLLKMSSGISSCNFFPLAAAAISYFLPPATFSVFVASSFLHHHHQFSPAQPSPSQPQILSFTAVASLPSSPLVLPSPSSLEVLPSPS
ncbi:hypothetical protein U1Q18_010143 [Sarracenia purpurea var. burkii]